MKIERDPDGNITHTVKSAHPSARRFGQYILFFIVVTFLFGVIASVVH